jgi:hypothetical protein
MYNKMKRGLFGRKNGAMGVMPGDQPDYGMGDFPPMGGPQQQDPFPQRKGPFDTMPGQGFPQQAAPKQGFMSKLPGMMADIGSILDDDDNGRSMQARQERSYQEQQERAKAQAAQQAKMEQRDYDGKNWMFQQKWERDNPNNDTANDFNFFKGLPPEDRVLFQQMKPQYRFDPATGTFVQVQTSQPVADNEFGGWGDGPDTPPATVGVPAPTLGANGLPQQLTQDQYQAVVQSLGKDKTDAWARQNNIRIAQ